MKKKQYQMLLCMAMSAALVFQVPAYAYGPSADAAFVSTVTEHFEEGTKVSNGSVKIVNLYGTWSEMGRQYGKLMKSELNNVYSFTSKIADASESNQQKAEKIKNTQADQNGYTVRTFISGAAETSGLSTDQLNMVNAVERIAGLPNCSAVVAWDDYAKDNLVVGRNYDYSSMFHQLNDDVVVTVYHPADGSLATATIGYTGEIYAVNAMNEKGLFMELNNGTPSTKQKPENPCLTGTSVLFDMMFQADSLQYTDLFFQTNICSSSYIINMADSKSARSYEWCAAGAKQGEHILDPGLLVSTNHFMNDQWGFETPTDAASWESLTRRQNLTNLANADKGQIDAQKMMEIMNTKLEDGGATNDMTVYQLVAEPESLTIWLKITGAADWTEIDMSNYLK